jgi:hypothetical protein
MPQERRQPGGLKSGEIRQWIERLDAGKDCADGQNRGVGQHHWWCNEIVENTRFCVDEIEVQQKVSAQAKLLSEKILIFIQRLETWSVYTDQLQAELNKQVIECF